MAAVQSRGKPSAQPDADERTAATARPSSSARSTVLMGVVLVAGVALGSALSSLSPKWDHDAAWLSSGLRSSWTSANSSFRSPTYASVPACSPVPVASAPTCPPAETVPSPQAPKCTDPAGAGGSSLVLPKFAGQPQAAPQLTQSYLRGFDVTMRGVCVVPNMPYQVAGLSPEACGDAAVNLELRNATKNRVKECKHDRELSRAVCRSVGRFCRGARDVWNGASADMKRITYIEEAVIVPMEFWDSNYGHIVTDAAAAVAAIRFAQTSPRQRYSAEHRPEDAYSARVPTFIWRLRSKPFADKALPALWGGYMRESGLRYLPAEEGQVCFGTVTIVAQPLNMVSWQRLASAPFLTAASTWGGQARLVQWPADHPMRGDKAFDEEAVAAAAKRVDALAGSGGPSDPGLGGFSRATVLARSRELRRKMTEAAPADLMQGPACAGGGAPDGARKPVVLVINRKGKRKVRNMGDLIKWFGSQGYDAREWDPAGKGPAQQANEVQAADILVSNHGQGQAWGMFMREDAVMVTLCSENQLELGSCTYYPIAARNGGHSTRRIFTMVSKDAQYFQGRLRSDAEMKQLVRSQGKGVPASDWHYKQTHFEDIDVKMDQFVPEWGAFLSDGEASADGSAAAFWKFWCSFDDVVSAIDEADGEALPTRDVGSREYLGSRLPRLGDGLSLM